MAGTTIWGGAGNDTIWGSAVTDLLFGGTGNDYLLGRVGDDIVLGGDGNDRLNGGASNDSLEGGNGQDTIIGQAGDDSLFGNAGIDRLNGDNGIDWLEGGDGRDTLRGGNGMDNIAGNTPDDIVQDSGWHPAPASPPAILDSGEDAGDGFAGGSPPTFEAFSTPPPLTVSVLSSSQNESMSTISFTVMLSAVPTSTFTINYNTADGPPVTGAVAGSDYTATSGMLTFIAGDIMTSQFVTVPIQNDTLVEPDETFTLTLSGLPVDVTFGSGSGVGVGTIQNDDIAMSGSGSGAGTPTLNVSDGGGSEGSGSGGGTAWFSVNLSSSVATATTVNWTVSFPSGNTAAAADFPTTGLTGSVTIAANATSEMIQVPLNDDALVESPETFTLTVSASGTNPGDLTADGTIYDNEPEISISDWSGPEGSGSGSVTAEFTVTLSRASTNTVSVDYFTFDGTATDGSDYTGAATTTLTFAPGDTTQTVSIPIIDDADVEPTAQTFSVNLSNAVGATIGDGSGDGTIYDNEPEISISDWNGSEGSGSGSVTAEFTVTLSHASTNTVSVDYSTFDGTAIDGSDYTGAPTTTLTFAPGVTTQTISIPIIDDADVELGGAEIFSVDLTNAVGATISDSAGMGAIEDNEPEISIADGSGTEWTFGYGSGSGSGSGHVSLQVTLSRASSQIVTVNYAASVDISQPLANRAATTDYGPAGTVTFAPGDTTKTILIPIVDDALVEFYEKFKVSLSGAGGASISALSGTAKGTIYDNEPTISIDDSMVSEDVGVAQIQAHLSHSSPFTISLTYSTGGGTASPSSDYFPVMSGTVTFAAGAIDADLPVQIIDDFVDEPAKTFLVDLLGAAGATINDSQGEVTINDYDALQLYVGLLLPDEDEPSPPVLSDLSSAGWVSIESAEFAYPINEDEYELLVPEDSYIALKTAWTGTNAVTFNWTNATEHLDAGNESAASQVVASSATTIQAVQAGATQTKKVAVVTINDQLSVPGFQNQKVSFTKPGQPFKAGDSFSFDGAGITVTPGSIVIAGNTISGTISTAANAATGMRKVIFNLDGGTRPVKQSGFFTVYRGAIPSLVELLGRRAAGEPIQQFNVAVKGGNPRLPSVETQIDDVIAASTRAQITQRWNTFAGTHASLTDWPKPITQAHIDVLIDAAVQIEGNTHKAQADLPDVPLTFWKAFLTQLALVESNNKVLAMASVPSENSYGVLQFNDARVKGISPGFQGLVFAASQTAQMAIFQPGFRLDWKAMMIDASDVNDLKMSVSSLSQDWRADPFASFVNGIRSSQQYYGGMVTGVGGYDPNDDYRVDLASPTRANGRGSQRDVFEALAVAHRLWSEVIGGGGVYGGRVQTTSPNEWHTTGNHSSGMPYMSADGIVRAGAFRTYYDTNAPAGGY
ncbi:MAG: Calx-beta domain-containing protein [Planctomycetaceae bacterium]